MGLWVHFMRQVPAAALVWPEFHNGCAMGLRLKGYAKACFLANTHVKHPPLLCTLHFPLDDCILLPESHSRVRCP